MTNDERLNWLKQIETDIEVCSLDATFEETAKSCAIRSAIEELEERKTGKWIIIDNDDGNLNLMYKCSLCGHSDIQAKSQKVPYCWWCGAEMVKEGAEE